MPSSSNYYDIDAILAEEEMIPCRTQFHFSHLAHLDPELPDTKHTLPEKSLISMPIWAVEEWAKSSYVRISMPKHYNGKARERIQSEPTEVDLRAMNGCYFTVGQCVVDLMDTVSENAIKYINTLPSSRRRDLSSVMEKAQANLDEANKLRQLLHTVYSGDRLCQTMNWALCSVDDDVSMYTRRLSGLERRLFQQGMIAMTNHEYWKVYGNRQVLQQQSPSKTKHFVRTVTDDADKENNANTKRQKIR